MSCYDDKFSDEQIQAFVDDEIDTHDRAEIMEAVRKDEKLACRVCELLQLKDSVRLAYREPPQSDHANKRWQTSHKTGLSIKTAAAVVLFTVGSVTGWLLHTQQGLTSATPAAKIAQMAPAEKEYKRVILHVSTADPARLGQALDDAELLLSGYKDQPEMVQLEVVANTEGLTLLRADTSPYVERIRRLAQEYDNISFLACSRTIEKLRMKGINVHLVPEAMVIPGALEEIVDKLQEGWVYIRV
jgi:intracellular sulfur oxidation DsrE/DsrF family protein